FFGNDLTMGPAWAACADVGERYTGTLSGAMNMIAALAGACGTALAGYLFRQGQPELVFIIFSCVYVMAALCWLGVDVTQRLADAEWPRYSAIRNRGRADGPIQGSHGCQRLAPHAGVGRPATGGARDRPARTNLCQPGRRRRDGWRCRRRLGHGRLA